MTGRVQIVKREPEPGAKWVFVAHGARYQPAEAEDVRQTLERRGCKVQFLPVED